MTIFVDVCVGVNVKGIVTTHYSQIQFFPSHPQVKVEGEKVLIFVFSSLRFGGGILL